MDNLNQIFAKNIIRLRNEHHLTQLELAEKLNYSDKAVSRWERAEAIPDAKVLVTISEMFDISLDDLLKNDVKPQLKMKRKKLLNNITNAAGICFIGVWTVALLTFIIMWLCSNPQWLVFVYALPVSLIVLLVFNSVWGKSHARCLLVSLLVWSIIAAVYLTALAFSFNWWQLFLLGVPAQIIVVLSFKFRK